MAGVLSLGTVIATQEGPSVLEFEFVISEETARHSIESGSFIQTQQDSELIYGVIQDLRRVNRYYSSADIVHGSSQGFPVSSVYPSERWDYVIGKVRVLGCFRNGFQQRSTKPVLPGSQVEFADEIILKKVLGLSDRGMDLGKLRQTDLNAIIDIDKLLQKHLAILSISGGGKSYTTSVVIEELMRRKPDEGRPCTVIFDVHGEYKDLVNLTKYPEFKHAKVDYFIADQLQLALGYLSPSDLRKFFPTMSHAQARDLGPILNELKRSGDPVLVSSIIDRVYKAEINPLVKDALLGWLSMLKSLDLFGNSETPDLEKTLEPGKLVIIDLSPLVKLWKKQVIVHYFLSRIFELRRTREIPPTISILEEAHQFAPEVESTVTKPIIHTIAREGRKFLCSLVLISQRPVNLSTTALSQCNTHLILRILNPHDLAWIGKSSEGINQETLGMITSLGVGEGLLVGEAVKYPVFIQIRKKILKAEFDETLLSRESRKYEKMKITK